MKRVGTLIPMLFALISVTLAHAEAQNVDWKLYGAAPLNGVSTLCFYDAAGLVTEPNGHVRVWTECLSRKDVDTLENTKGSHQDHIVHEAAKKLAQYYEPPIGIIQKLDAKNAAGIIADEVTADTSYLQPLARIFYELNCSERMGRELSVSTYTNGEFSSIDKPLDWKYIAPQTNVGNLSTILCRAK